MKNIFAIETGQWYRKYRESTISPIFKFLNRSCFRTRYTHRRAFTEEELFFNLRQLGQQGFKNYPIAYFAFHGQPDHIAVFGENGREVLINLDDIFDELEGKCGGKIIHFGCCHTFNISSRKRKKYLDKTNALGISGYQKEIDWVDSSIADLFFLSILQDSEWSRSLLSLNRMPFFKALFFRLTM